MWRVTKCVVELSAAAIVVLAVGVATADPIVIYKFNEGTGTLAHDESGNGYDGTITGATWQAGGFNGSGFALSFSGGDQVENTEGGNFLNGLSALTMAAWVKSNITNSDRGIFNGEVPDGGDNVCTLRYDASGASFGGSNVMKMAVTAGGTEQQLESSPNVQTTEWQHVAMTWESGGLIRLYLDGVEDEPSGRSNPNNGGTITGCNTFIVGKGAKDASNSWDGLIDEVRIFDTALSEAEIQLVMLGTGGPEFAGSPSPEDEETDVFRDTPLTWSPGDFAAEHDVYLGTDFDEVNDATTTDAAYQGRQADTTFDPGRLLVGQTYYWRIDEVNAAPDKTIFTGVTWSFTVEPLAYAVPVAAVTATASSVMAPGTAAAAADGTGLDAQDRHASGMETMWLSLPTDPEPWIQFDLGRLEALDRIHVWNHNSQTEAVLGFGIKDARIETSRDGQAWAEAATLEIPRASGLPTDGGSDIALAGAVARFVRITALSNRSALGLKQKGLAEVRFYAVPTRARKQSPADGAADQEPLLALSWRPGREADRHEVLVGTDPNALTLIDTVDSPAATASVALDSKIYWRVNEVNDAGDPAVWEGPLWSFQTNAFLSVDDMEAYASEDGAWVWETWLDGFENNANGALLGHGGDDMETGTVFAGRQSLPYTYGQNAAANSEATRPIDRNWGAHGIVSLSLMFFGQTTNTPGTMYLKVNGQRIADYPVPADLTLPQWQAWTVDLPASARGNVQNLTIGFDGGSGLVFFDAIRLYPQASATVNPTDPGSDGLLAYYPLDGAANDASGNGLDGAPLNNPLFLNDPVRGQVLTLDGLGACVDLGTNEAFNFAGGFSVAVWAQIQEFTTNWGHVLVGKRGENNVGWQLRRHSGNPNLVFTVRGTLGPDDPRGTVDVLAYVNEWFQVTAVFDPDAGQRSVYINGLLDVSVEDANSVAPATHNAYIGARANAANTAPEGFFSGSLDEVRIYNRPLSQAEALGLAGRQEAIFQPF